MDNLTAICPNCHETIPSTSKFCPNCGKELHPLTSISILRQVWIYIVSLLLPPLGLIWTFKYFRSEYPAVKRVAFIALLLTVISVVATIWLSYGFFQTLQQTFQQQMNSYGNLGL